MKQNRPHITCLMMTSIDGKILSETWGDHPQVKKLAAKYEEIHDEIGIPTWIVGRTTMEKDFTHYLKPIYKEGDFEIDRNDFIAVKDASSYAIAIDGQAKLGWESPMMQGEHVITVLTEEVQDAYLAHLQDIGLSYIFAGKSVVDLEVAVEKLYSLFSIDKLMLEGGGTLNGSFLDLGLIDEIYQILLPLADGSKDASTFFDREAKSKKISSTLLGLKDVRHLEDDALLLHFSVETQVEKADE